MSSSSVSDQVRIKLWTRAGGRCEYLGCNKDLWTDEVTLSELNDAHIAHIIAESPNGPRGDTELSEKLKGEFSNLMLLCKTHHRLIDIEQVEEHPVELLQQFKEEHEGRTAWLTSLESKRKTHILALKTNIGPRKGCIAFEQACEALLENGKYPICNPGIVIDLTGSELRDDETIFWEAAQQDISKQVAAAFSQGCNGKQIDHASIFAIAPIPLLIHLGREIGDIVPCDVYQPHRDTQSWVWQEGVDELQYQIEEPTRETDNQINVAINLSLSGIIAQEEIETVLGTDIPVYKFTIENPHRDFLKNQKHLRTFKDQFQQLLANIRGTQGAKCEIHLFPAIPPSIAIEIGRCLLPKSDPVMHVYDHNNAVGGFSAVLQVNQRSD